MRKLIPAIVVCVVCAGCRTGTDILHAGQASERAMYLKSEAAGRKKEARVAEEAIKILQEKKDRELSLLKRYEEQAREADRRIAELRWKTCADEAERRAVDLLIERLRSERDAMRTKAQEKRELMGVIRDQIRQKQSYRNQMLEQARAALGEAEAMERRAAARGAH